MLSLKGDWIGFNDGGPDGAPPTASSSPPASVWQRMQRLGARV